MNERDQDKLKVGEAYRTLKGKELSDVVNAYFKKYIVPAKKESIADVFDGGIPQF